MKNNITSTIIFFAENAGIILHFFNKKETSSCSVKINKKQTRKLSSSFSVAKDYYYNMQPFQNKSTSQCTSQLFEGQKHHKHFLLDLLLQKKDQ